MSWLDGIPEYQSILLKNVQDRDREQLNSGNPEPWVTLAEWEWELLGYPTWLFGRTVRTAKATSDRYLIRPDDPV